MPCPALCLLTTPLSGWRALRAKSRDISIYTDCDGPEIPDCIAQAKSCEANGVAMRWTGGPGEMIAKARDVINAGLAVHVYEIDDEVACLYGNPPCLYGK